MRPLSRFLAGLVSLVIATSDVVGTPFAYIGNLETRELTVIDTASSRVSATVPLPEPVNGIAVNRAGTRVYAANSQNLFVIDTATNSVVATVNVGTGIGGFAGVAVNPAGTRVYVTSNWSENSVKVIETGTNTVVDTMSNGFMPVGIVVNPEGTRVYVANMLSPNVVVYDAATNGFVRGIRIDTPHCGAAAPFGLAVNAAGTRLYVANQNCLGSDGNWYMSVIDTETYETVADVATGTAGGSRGVAVSPDGMRVYLSNGAVIDTASNKVVATFPGSPLNGLALHPDGSRVYLPNLLQPIVSVVDTGASVVVATVPVGGQAFAFGQFVGPASAPDYVATVIEYYHAALDHYFITWMPNEIAALDTGTQIKGWARTGYSFRTYTIPQVGTSPVCRYYIPPGLGDSHFFGRDTAECDVTEQKNPSFVLEDPSFMQMFLPKAGVCPKYTTPVSRTFSNRPDANHRYTIHQSVRKQMVAKGWIAEGDGPDFAVMCAPQ